jgi:hypothetical protein
MSNYPHAIPFPNDKEIFNDLSHSLSLGYLNTHPINGLKIEKIKTSGGQI